MSQGHCLKDRPMQKKAHWRKREWATMCRGLPSSLERFSLLVDVLATQLSINTTKRPRQSINKKKMFTLVFNLGASSPWLVGSVAFGTVTAHHDWGRQTEQNCSCNGVETNKRKMERNHRCTGSSRAHPQWPKALLWALSLKVVPPSNLHSEN